jgi:hypothetical protein
MNHLEDRRAEKDTATGEIALVLQQMCPAQYGV